MNLGMSVVMLLLALVPVPVYSTTTHKQRLGRILGSPTKDTLPGQYVGLHTATHSSGNAFYTTNVMESKEGL